MQLSAASEVALEVAKRVSLLHRPWYPLRQRLALLAAPQLRRAAALGPDFASTAPDLALFAPLGTRTVLNESWAAMRRRLRPTPPPNVGVGVSPTGRRDDWRVAIRAWSGRDLETPALEGIRRLHREEVDVRVTGVVRARIGRASTDRCRPLRPGCSIGHHATEAGTLGAFARDAGGRVLVLSNNHVLTSCNSRTSDDQIVQPGLADSGRLPDDRIGELAEYIKLKVDDNLVDAAVAVVDDHLLPVEESLPGIGPVHGACSNDRVAEVATAAEPVRKVGRSTGLTTGRISATALRTFPVLYGSVTYWFGPVLEVEGAAAPFSLGGDSGALVVDEGNHAVGLLFAGDEDGYSYLNPIASVLELLHLELL